jgi:protein-S-isoprenylcysteine O-methyltransferase Ste14
VASVLILAWTASLAADKATAAALIILPLMGLQTLSFAAPASRGTVSRQRLLRVCGMRAAGFAATALLASLSYAFQRIFILGDWRLDATLWMLLPLGFSALLDSASSRPYVDEYWTLGSALISLRARLAPVLRKDIGASFIKVFFYPLMFVYLEKYVGLLGDHWRPSSWSAPGIYDSLAIYYLLIDLVFGTTGYALSLRILNNRVRSINQYPIGWMVTLACYSPFWDVLERVLIFQWHAYWIPSTRDWPLLQFAWLLMIAACFVTYAWATVALGPRFSNLTYRGTVSSGPYRLMRHPAYVSKVVSYWLITVPFVPLHGVAFALQQSLVLALSSSIYYFRAKYEEKHLKQYPEYRAYACSPIFRKAAEAPDYGSISAASQRVPQPFADNTP